MFSDSTKTHIQTNHKNVHSTHIIYSLFKYPLKKKDFVCPHFLYYPKLNMCLLRVEGCMHTFSFVKVVINHKAKDNKNIYTCSLWIKYIPQVEPAQACVGFKTYLAKCTLVYGCVLLLDRVWTHQSWITGRTMEEYLAPGRAWVVGTAPLTQWGQVSGNGWLLFSYGHDFFQPCMRISMY